MFLLCLLIGVAWTTPVAHPGLGDAVEDAVNDAKDWTHGAVNDIADGLDQAGDWTEGAFNDAADWTQGATNDVAYWTQGAAEDVKDFFGNLG